MQEQASAIAVDPVAGPTTATAAPAASVHAPRRRKMTFNWRGLVSIAVFFLAWELAVRLRLPGFHELPGPITVARVLVQDFLYSPGYWESWAISFKRVLLGFLFAQILGVPLGLLLGTSRRFNAIVFPVFEMMRPIPPLAWVPLSILFWPTNEASIVFITFIGAFFIITINVYDGVKAIKKEHLWLASSLGAPRLTVFRRIIIPAVIPSIAVGMTLGIAVTWNVVIAAEMIASDSGLGRLTWEGYVSSTLPVVFVGMISIGVAGALSTWVVDVIEWRMMPWKRR
ncbi:MAG: ABC transporter permease [Pseudomonadota bacterium]